MGATLKGMFAPRGRNFFPLRIVSSETGNKYFPSELFPLVVYPNLVTLGSEFMKLERCVYLDKQIINKSQKGLPLETKNTQNYKNGRLSFLESLYMQHCSL